jgi:hypothetical protein
MRRAPAHSKLRGVEDEAEYVAECLWPGVTEVDLAELDARARAATSGDVRYLGSLLMPADEVVFCFFQGPSAQAVETVAGRAGIPFERILESVRGPGPTRRGDS